MRAIVLAAGRGRRMGVVSNKTPKFLLPFKDTTVIQRLIYQLLNFTQDITVVVGFEEKKVTEILRSTFKDRINIIYNDRYKEDVNILSLSIGINDTISPFVVFESDCIYEDRCIEKVFSLDLYSCSAWFTMGKFVPSMSGGILKSDEFFNVTDVKIVPKYEGIYKNYRKLIGILKVGENEVGNYIKSIEYSMSNGIDQYYLQSWIDNLVSLPSVEVQLDDCVLGAFNTYDEYTNVISMF